MIKSPLQNEVRRFQLLQNMVKESALYTLVTEKIAQFETFISEKLSNEKLVEIIKPLIPEVKDGNTPTEQELISLILPLIPEIENGHTPTNEEIIELIKPLIPKVENGATPSKEELLDLIQPLIPKVKGNKLILTQAHIDMIAEKAAKKVKLPEIIETDPLSIIDKIMSLPEGKRLTTSHIEGLDQTISAFQSQLKRGYLHGGGISSLQAGNGITLVKNTDGSYTIISTASGVGAWQSPPESPLPDGSVVQYTVGTSVPTDVIADGTTLFKGHGYTYSSPYITLDNGATQFVRFR